jgi:hypothetical protein
METTTEFTPIAIVRKTNVDGVQYIRVAVTWFGEGLDRQDGHGWLFDLGHEKLAARLARAIDDGVVFHNISLAIDVNGKTYVNASSRVLGKYANADLKKLGY